MVFSVASCVVSVRTNLTYILRLARVSIESLIMAFSPSVKSSKALSSLPIFLISSSVMFTTLLSAVWSDVASVGRFAVFMAVSKSKLSVRRLSSVLMVFGVVSFAVFACAKKNGARISAQIMEICLVDLIEYGNALFYLVGAAPVR